jgi:predicted aminopeptidase
MRCRIRIGAGFSLAVLMVMVGAGCALPPGYIPSVVAGELKFLSQRQPIEEGLANPMLTDEERDKLSFLIRARDYGEQVIGLNVSNNFQEFVYLGDEPLAWSLSASPRDAIEAYVWDIPIAGPLPYLGFFDLDQAKRERDRLVDRGYDTFMYEVDAYALPYLPDPVTSRVLRRGYGDLADVVMHELTHNSVSNSGDATFSESVAVFVGRQAGEEFLAEEFGPDAAIIQETRDGYEDQELFNGFMRELVAELTALYESGKSSEEILAAREVIFEATKVRLADEILPLMNNPSLYEPYTEVKFNNAFLLVNVRYNSSQELFEQAYEVSDRNWSVTLRTFAQASRADDPWQFLADYVESN